MTTTTTKDNVCGKTQTYKKKVRRRLQTDRPYQERFLNMAEARREIVTALKQHRASMRQATKTPPPLPPPPPPPPPLDPLYWPLNFDLPCQPLGLNLNFQDFNLDLIQNSSSSSSSSSTSSNSSSSIFPTNPHIYSSPSPPPPTFIPATSYSKQLMMEPENNVATSTWWSELMLKTVEPDIIKSEEGGVLVEDDVFSKLSDVMEFPTWLINQTEEEELFHPFSLSHYSPLSCVEIGEIEGMVDGEDWLA